MSDMRSIAIPATLDAASRKKDKTIGIRVTSNLEVSPEDLMEIDRRIGEEGWFIWQGNRIKPEDIPVEDAPGEERKSKIQRLKGVHYVYWSTKTDQSQDFQSWWDSEFERLMTKYKEKLD